MIANITSGKGFEGLIKYHEKKINSGDGELLYDKDMFVSSSDCYIKTFNILSDKNQKLQKTAFHVSLNLPPDEKISDDKFKEIADDYMKEMGYEKQPYVVYKHNDRDHSHIHIVSCRVQENGKTISDSQERYRSQKASEKIEKKHGLFVVDRASDPKKVRSVESILDKKALLSMPVKDRIAYSIRQTLDDKKPASMKNFTSELKALGVGVDTIKGTNPYGEKYEGLIYYALESEEDKHTHHISASQFYFKPTLDKLRPVFAKNLKNRKDLSKLISAKLSSLSNDYYKINYADYQNLLLKQGVQAKFHKNSSGIYGISFIDSKTGIEFKGSDIGKAYSWNSLSKLLNDKITLKQSVLNNSHRDLFESLKKDNRKDYPLVSQLMEKKGFDWIYNQIEGSYNINSLKDPELVDLYKTDLHSYLQSKFNQLNFIKKRENENIQKRIDLGISTLSEFSLKDKGIMDGIVKSLDLVVSENAPGVYNLSHRGKMEFKTTVDQKFFSDCGFPSYKVGTTDAVLDPTLNRIYKALIFKNTKAPILYFNNKFDPSKSLNQKGLDEFNKLQNQRYVDLKLSHFRKQGYSVAEMLQSLILRGVSFDLNKQGQLVGTFFNQNNQKNLQIELPSDLSKKLTKKDKQLLAAYQKDMAEKKNALNIFKLNDAIDKKDLPTIEFLKKGGTKTYLPKYELENIKLDPELEKALETESTYIDLDDSYEYYYEDFSESLSHSAKNIISYMSNSGESNEDLDVDPFRKRRKRKRRI